MTISEKQIYLGVIAASLILGCIAAVPIIRLEALFLKPEFLAGCIDDMKSCGRSEIKNAVRFYQNTIKSRPQLSAEANADIGLCYYLLGDFKKAIRYYAQAMSLNPNVYSYHFDAGVASLAINDLDGAVGHFNDSLKLIPATELQFYNLSKTLTRKGNDDAAKQAMIRGLRARQDGEMALLNLAQIYYAKKRGEKIPGHQIKG